MALNPNYPVIEERWGPSWTAAGASLPSSRWVNVRDRTLSQASARRGKQYELDQAQAGEYNIVLGSQDGALDPTNTGGPYASHILPYQPYQRRAQWPPTANMLDATIATGGEGYSTGTIPASFGFTGIPGNVTATIATPTAGYAWQGSNVFSFALPSGMGAQAGIFSYNRLSIRPGKTVTFSLYVANTTASTSLPLTAWIRWLAADGSAQWGNGTGVTLTGASGSPAWSRVTVTATAPATGSYVYGMWVGLDTGGTAPTGAPTLYVDGMQLEWASSASTWVSPGTWYPIFSGFTERWATQWAEGGTYGQVTPTAVDSFALLSQVTLKDVFLEEVESRSPRFFYPLGDPAGSTNFADATGSFASAPLVYAKTGSGNWTSGNSITSASTSGGMAGSSGTVVTANPASPGVIGPVPATVLSLDNAGIRGPGTSAWTRMVAFRTSTTPTTTMNMWMANVPQPPFITGPQSTIELYIDSSGILRIITNAPGQVTTSTAFSGTSVCDGNWHLAVFGISGTTMNLSIDGVSTSYTISSTKTPTTAGDMQDRIGAGWNYSTLTADYAYKGDLAFVAEFPSLLSTSDMTTLYAPWRTAASGESSAVRYSRILRYAGYAGSSNIGTGLTSSMGPATDLNGADAMSALNNVVSTENGEHFVAADGTITFLGRNVRYNTLTPALTFGDGSGEIPYEELQLDFDSTHLSNYATVTQESTGTNYVAQDSASIASYYTRTMTRTLNTTSGQECQDAADYFVSRYKAPLTRVQTIKLHPSAVPSLWPTLLALELGTRVRIIRRPIGGATVTVDCFVEQISWDMDSSNEAWVTLQCSPVDATVYTQFSDTLAQFDTSVFAY